MSRRVYSTDRKRIVTLARQEGKTDREILRALLSGEYGVKNRKKILLEWAEALEMEPSEVLRAAAQYGLIPNPRMPKQ